MREVPLRVVARAAIDRRRQVDGLLMILGQPPLDDAEWARLGPRLAAADDGADSARAAANGPASRDAGEPPDA
jgi:hypothetical protein